MSTRAIAIFVKTPGLSPIKTRLAAGIGEDKALEFYNLALDCVEDLARSINVAPHWAIGEENELSHERWQNLERLWTGDGGLGQRQHHVYATLLQQFDQVMLIGTDCPQLSPENIEAGFAALETHEFAFGPAHDGGYNFIAGRSNIPPEVWNAVQYSQNDTRENLRKILPAASIELTPHSDVDEEQDLQTVINEMPGKRSLAQKKVIDWINGLEI